MDRFLQALESLQLTPHRKLHMTTMGDWKGVGRGQTYDFYGHRPYSPGDDIRQIDWNAYMRTQALHVREYNASKRMCVNILVDSSKSMDHGRLSKHQWSKTAALGMAYVAAKQSDLVSVYAGSDVGVKCLENVTHRKALPRFQKFFEACGTEGADGLAPWLGQNKIKPGVTVILSDFYDPAYEKAIETLYDAGHDVVVVQILSEEELSPDFSGGLRLSDMETGTTLNVDVTERVIEKYKARLREKIRRFKTVCDQRHIRYFFSSTGQAPMATLSALMRY